MLRSPRASWPIAVLLLGFLLSAVACNKEKEEKADATETATPVQMKALDPAIYTDWEIFRFQNVQLIHPPNFHLQEKLPEIAAWFAARLPNFCGSLEMPVYPDTLKIYCYTGYGQGLELTGQEYPFATDSSIHFWLPCSYGSLLMEFCLRQWKMGDPQFGFLKEGFKALYDFSGQNYFSVVRYYQQTDSGMTLSQLVADTAIDSNTERFQSAYAATFVNYILADYGAGAIRSLYISNEPLETALLRVTNLTMSQADSLWHQFILETFPDAVFDPKKNEKIIEIPLH